MIISVCEDFTLLQYFRVVCFSFRSLQSSDRVHNPLVPPSKLDKSTDSKFKVSMVCLRTDFIYRSLPLLFHKGLQIYKCRVLSGPKKIKG